jgi:phage terminase small subunit
MPKLKSLRREHFAIEVASMTPLASAYVAAGYADSCWAGANARKLSHVPEVAARIDELQTECRARSGIKIEYLQAQLLKIIEARPQAPGDREHEVATKMTSDADGNWRFEVDRMAAIVALCKTIGAFSDAAQVTVSATATAGAMAPAITDEDRVRALESLMARQPQKPVQERLAENMRQFDQLAAEARQEGRG